jgi:hypothetical protein
MEEKERARRREVREEKEREKGRGERREEGGEEERGEKWRGERRECVPGSGVHCQLLRVQAWSLRTATVRHRVW